MSAGPSSFVVRPAGPLRGRVRVRGAKNSALKLMAACLLAEGRHVLANVPRIVDVGYMAEMLEAVGARAERLGDGADGEPGDLVVDAPAAPVPETPLELVEKMRASVVVLGPLLARCGRVAMALPGGDDFGVRPIDIHLHALAQMGAVFAETDDGSVVGHVPAGRLRGARVALAYPSHTATDNILMAATLADGTTVIENAAREPEVCDLAAFLCAMGARITGAGTSRLVVRGVDELQPAKHEVIPDRVVAATFLVAAGVAGGEVEVLGARPDHMDLLVRKLRRAGVEVAESAEGLVARGDGGRPRAVDVSTLPYPGVATDYKPLLVTLLSRADGVAIVTENLFSGRFRYVDELRRMGADIETEGHHAVVRGVPALTGAEVMATDLRAGAALVLAGTVARGETVVDGACHVDRGYEDLAADLAGLGADISRR